MSQIDFSKAPFSATHFLRARAPEDTAWFCYVDGSPFQWHDGEWQCIVCVPPLTEAIPAIPAVDWSKGPADATHWGPATGPDRGPGMSWDEAFYRLDDAGKGWFATELVEWTWILLLNPMSEERRAMLTARPVAEEFVPFDFSGSVRGPEHRWADGKVPPAGHAVEYRVSADHPFASGTFVGILADENKAVVRDGEMGDLIRLDGHGAISWESAPWDGQGLPPVGCECNVTPHNTLWGFDSLDTRRVKVLGGYVGEFVWLMELHSDGSDSFSLITTRTDKVDFTPIKTAEQIAAKERKFAIVSAVKDLEKTLDRFSNCIDSSSAARGVIVAMIDAGYRKAPGYAELLEFLAWVQSSEKHEAFSTAVMVRVAKTLHAVRGDK